MPDRIRINSSIMDQPQWESGDSITGHTGWQALQSMPATGLHHLLVAFDTVVMRVVVQSPGQALRSETPRTACIR